MDIFPYEYRGNQKELVSFIRKAVENGQSAVIESGTGSGKTICALTGTIETAKENGCKVIFLTRTKSQQKQVMIELKALSKIIPILGVPVQGRSLDTCPVIFSDESASIGTPEELSHLCSEYKKMNNGVCQCEYFSNMKAANILEVETFCRTNVPTSEEFAQYCLDKGWCPYEMSKILLASADVVVAPYPFVFMPQVLYHFSQWLNIPLERMVFITDETHNLPDYLREVLSFQYTRKATDLAEAEAREWGDPELVDGLSVSDFISVFREVMDMARREYMIDDDGELPPGFIEEELMSRLGLISTKLFRVFHNLKELGEKIADEKRSRKKLPRSYIRSMGRFLSAWVSVDESYVKLIVGDEKPRFEAFCMDPAMSAGPLRYCRASIQMSGTLEPMTSYVEELGLKDAVYQRFGNVFSEDNLLVLSKDDVSTKYDDLYTDESMVPRICDDIVSICSAVEKNTAIFFPSYSFMDRILTTDILKRLNRNVIFEKKGMHQNELMNAVKDFSNTSGSILFAVFGGRISEGLDFPGDTMEMAILVGIPYPKPTQRHKALVRYYNYRYGNGWEHVGTVPTVRKMRQAIGRLIRSETDRGVAIILDRRAENLPGLDVIVSKNPALAVKIFFEKTNNI